MSLYLVIKSGTLLQLDADVGNMWEKHFQYIISIVLSVLVIAVVFAIISLAYIVIKPESFFITYANFVFIVGGIVMTLGAFIEFFVRSHSSAVGRYLLMPYRGVMDLPAIQAPASDKVEKNEDKTSGGWMLIFIGALVIAISFVSALIGMKQTI
jgi:hypothetical protein